MTTMADHPDITPAELKVATATFLATGSYTKAAQAIGRSRVGTMQALRRASDDNVRQRIYARVLDAVLAEAADAQRVAVRRNRKALNDPKRCEGATFALNDTMAKAASARTALAKMTGEHAAEKHQHHVDVTKLPDDALDAELHAFATRGTDAGGEGAAGAAPAGEGAAGSGAGDTGHREETPES